MNLAHLLETIENSTVLETRLANEFCEGTFFTSSKKSKQWLEDYLYVYAKDDFSNNQKCNYKIYHTLLSEELLNFFSQFNNLKNIDYYREGKAGECLVEDAHIIISDRRDEIIVKRANSFYIITDSLPAVSRIVREILTRTLENNGYLPINAGGIQYNNTSILICPNSKDGHVPLMLDIVSNLHANIIAHEIIYCKQSDTKIYAYPTAWSVTLPEINRHSAIQKVLKQDYELLYSQYPFWNEDSNNHSSIVAYPKRIVEITPKEIAELLGVNLIDTAIPKLLVFVSIQEKTSYYELSKSETLALVEEQFYHLYEDDYPDVMRLLEVAPKQYELDKRDMAEFIASNVVAYQIHAKDGQEVSKIIEQILESSPEQNSNPLVSAHSDKLLSKSLLG